mgnify:CR=1 FL=1
MDILQACDLKKTYGTGEACVHALDGVSLNVEKGEFVAIVGTSGSGKSTLLHMLGGLDRPSSGKVFVDGKDIFSLKDEELTIFRRRKIGFVFQAYNLIGNLTVRENIEVGAYLSSRPLEIDELLDVLGLTEHQNKIPSQLSGGQQQRTAIGRAIVKNPDILLCDEPTGALDYHTSKDILALIERVNQKYGNTIVIVTHNDAIKNMADQIVKLKDGQIQDVEMNAAKVPAEQLEW